MQRMILAVALLAASIATAKAETVFVGNASVDFVSPAGDTTACGSTFKVGDFFRVVYRPRGGPLGNGGDSQLAVISSRSSVAMAVVGGDFKTGSNYGSMSVGSTVSIGSGSGAVTGWQQTPAAIAAGTPTVKIDGTFTKFFRINPCTLRLSGILLKR